MSQGGAPVLSVGPKTFFFDLKENDKGKYLRITEVRGGSAARMLRLMYQGPHCSS
jgi:hypothetical protein